MSSKISRTVFVGLILVAVIAIAALAYSLMTISSLQADINSLRESVDSLTEYVAPGGIPGRELVEAAKKEGKVVFYTSWATPNVEAYVKEFSKRYPWMTVEFVSKSSSVTYQAYQAEVAADVVKCDLINIALPALFPQMAANGQLMAYNITSSSHYPAGSVTEYYSPWRNNLVTPTINPQYVNATDLTSWWNLTDPKFKGKIAIEDPRASGSTYLMYYWLREQLGSEFWKQLGEQDCYVTTNVGGGMDRLVAGETYVWLAAIDIAWQYKSKGASIDWAYPTEGSLVYTAPIGIATKAPHPNCAKLFLEWSMSAEGQGVLTQIGAMSIRSPPPPPLAFIKSTTSFNVKYIEDYVDADNKTLEYRAEFSEFFGFT
jgi:iron(III) transport system substrate-binding protein